MFPFHDENKTLHPAYVTIVLIAINALVWLFVEGAGLALPLARAVCELGLIPGELTGMLPPGTRFPLGGGLVCLTDPGRQISTCQAVRPPGLHRSPPGAALAAAAPAHELIQRGRDEPTCDLHPIIARFHPGLDELYFVPDGWIRITSQDVKTAARVAQRLGRGESAPHLHAALIPRGEACTISC